MSSGKCGGGSLGCKCPQLSTLHHSVELICPRLWAGAARPGCPLCPDESSIGTGDSGTGTGSSASVPCCKWLQQGKARMAVAASCFLLCRAVLYHKGLETLKRDSNASLSHNPIFLLCCATQVLQGFFPSYPGKGHGSAVPQGSFLSYSPKFPL